jgi:hypothetical protein
MTEENLDLDRIRKWDLLALIFGYNELAKTSKSLGEKIWCRLAREFAKEEFEKVGGKIEITKDKIICTISTLPTIEFTVRDIELMKKAISDHERTTEVNDGDLEARQDG